MTNLTMARAYLALGVVLVLVVSAAVAQSPQVRAACRPVQAPRKTRKSRAARAIDGQAPPANQMRPQFTWPDPRYAPTLAETYRLGYIYGPRRMYRQAVRLGYPPVAVAVPRVPTDFFGYPMYGPVRFSARSRQVVDRP